MGLRARAPSAAVSRVATPHGLAPDSQPVGPMRIARNAVVRIDWRRSPGPLSRALGLLGTRDWHLDVDITNAPDDGRVASRCETVVVRTVVRPDSAARFDLAARPFVPRHMKWGACRPRRARLRPPSPDCPRLPAAWDAGRFGPPSRSSAFASATCLGLQACPRYCPASPYAPPPRPGARAWPRLTRRRAGLPCLRSTLMPALRATRPRCCGASALRSRRRSEPSLRRCRSTTCTMCPPR